jgi:hypothetical protein
MNNLLNHTSSTANHHHNRNIEANNENNDEKVNMILFEFLEIARYDAVTNILFYGDNM